MMKKLLLAMPVLLIILATVISMQPSEFHVERTAVISAPPAEVFSHINNLQKWDAWSPWAKLDPNATVAFEGPEAGAGALMRWSGNSDVGVGSMEITESKPASLIRMKLEFIEPMQGTSTSEFKLEGKEGGTVVVWSMDSHNNFMAKAIGLFMDCEAMIGEQYEKGLANLKAVAEKNG